MISGFRLLPKLWKTLDRRINSDPRLGFSVRYLLRFLWLNVWSLGTLTAFLTAIPYYIIWGMPGDEEKLKNYLENKINYWNKPFPSYSGKKLKLSVLAIFRGLLVSLIFICLGSPWVVYIVAKRTILFRKKYSKLGSSVYLFGMFLPILAFPLSILVLLIWGLESGYRLNCEESVVDLIYGLRHLEQYLEKIWR